MSSEVASSEQSPDGCRGAPSILNSETAGRKPVPTPRSTLRKLTPHRNAVADIINCQNDEDILTALESIPGVGSLRSLNKSPREELKENVDKSSNSLLSLQSSFPANSPSGAVGLSHHHTMGINSFGSHIPRDESLHSLGSSMTTPQFFLGKKVFHDGVVTCTRSTPENSNSANQPLSDWTTNSSSDTTSDTKSSTLDVTRRKSLIQERPLPNLPLSNSSRTSLNKIVSVQRSHEAIYTALLTPPHVCENDPAATDHYTELKTKKVDPGGLTLTGTIRRGKFKERAVDVTLKLTEDDLTKIEQRVNDKFHDRCFCGLRRGPHVFLLSVLSIPLMWVYGTLCAFFLGSMTWYNIFLHYNEELGCCHKLLSPFVLLLYPFWITPVTVGLGLYRSLSQVSWYWDTWLEEMANPDCGFMGWACAKMNLPDCSPYQVVLIGDKENLVSHSTPLTSCQHHKPTPI